MGTRSVTRIFADQFSGGPETEICRIYRQFDGYPSGHGADLIPLINKTLCNGISVGKDNSNSANGMGCLAASIIKGLKDDIGGIYMVAMGEEDFDYIDYVYEIRGDIGQKPTMTIKDRDGKVVFSGNADKAKRSKAFKD